MRRRVPQEKTTKTTSSGKGIVTRRAGYANAFSGSVWKCENWNLFFKEKVGNESCWSMRVVYVSWVVCNKNQWIPMETCVLYYIAIIDLLATTAMAVVRLPAISIDPFQLFCHHWGVVVFLHSPYPFLSIFLLKEKCQKNKEKVWRLWDRLTKNKTQTRLASQNVRHVVLYVDIPTFCTTVRQRNDRDLLLFLGFIKDILAPSASLQGKLITVICFNRNRLMV